MSPRHACTLAAAAIAVAAGGCGLGEGERDEGEATVRVTSDYGAELIAETAETDPSESDTVIKVLDRAAEIETRFGGGFVQSIGGLAGGVEAGRSLDWFFYVNGIESSVGSAEVPVSAGDRIWWDHRDWTDVMRVPAVVGSFPEPLAQASAEDPDPVRLECADGAEKPCADAGERLADAGVDFTNEALGSGGSRGDLRVLLGEWEDIRGDDAAVLLEKGPPSSGVFASPEKIDGRWSLALMDPALVVDDQLRPGGLVAAVRPGEEPPTWIVTGTDAGGLDAAVAALDEPSLRDHYALAILGGEGVPLPLDEIAAG